MNRREFALASGAGLLSGGTAARAAADPVADLERRNGGRLGVFAFDTGSGRILAHRADERFQMCSTFKLLAVSAVLSRVDKGHEHLNRRVRYGAADLADPSPVTGAHVSDGELPVEVLCAAASEVSDNAAANLLMKSIGGPPGLTSYLRSLGDTVTRVDRYELEANTRDAVRDTTSPRAMAQTVAKLVLGSALSSASRGRVAQWMANAKPGLARIRAGIPSDWKAGDRPGTSIFETNDVAVLWPTNRAPLVVAAYYDAAAVAPPAREQVLAELGSKVVEWAA